MPMGVDGPLVVASRADRHQVGGRVPPARDPEAHVAVVGARPGDQVAEVLHLRRQSLADRPRQLLDALHPHRPQAVSVQVLIWMPRGEQAQEVVDAAGAVQAHELQIVAGIRRGVIPCGDPPSRAHLLRRRENAQEQPRPVLHLRPPPGSVPVAVRDRSAALTDLIRGSACSGAGALPGPAAGSGGSAARHRRSRRCPTRGGAVGLADPVLVLTGRGDRMAFGASERLVFGLIFNAKRFAVMSERLPTRSAGGGSEVIEDLPTSSRRW